MVAYSGIRIWGRGVALCAVALLLAACASAQQSRVVRLSQELPPDTKITIGEISSRISGPEVGDIDVEGLMTQSLLKALEETNKGWSGDQSEEYATINLRIVDYKPGNAFGRWLMPGLGATVLSVEGNLVKGPGPEELAKIRDQRGVYAGGAFSIGAWRTIFDTVARDIIDGVGQRISRGGFVVEVDTWLKRDLQVAEASTKNTFALRGVVDDRLEKGRIGERFAAFGVSMGDVFFYRSVPDYVEEMVTSDLRAAGHRVVDSDEGISLSIAIDEFWVTTDTTALYWDIIATINLKVSVGDAEKSSQKKTKQFACRDTKRTYVWPSEELFNQVIDRCLTSLMQELRGDPIWQAPPPIS